MLSPDLFRLLAGLAVLTGSVAALWWLWREDPATTTGEAADAPDEGLLTPDDLPAAGLTDGGLGDDGLGADGLGDDGLGDDGLGDAVADEHRLDASPESLWAPADVTDLFGTGSPVPSTSETAHVESPAAQPTEPHAVVAPHGAADAAFSDAESAALQRLFDSSEDVDAAAALEGLFADAANAGSSVAPLGAETTDPGLGGTEVDEAADLWVSALAAPADEGTTRRARRAARRAARREVLAARRAASLEHKQAKKSKKSADAKAEAKAAKKTMKKTASVSGKGVEQSAEDTSLERSGGIAGTAALQDLFSTSAATPDDVVPAPFSVPPVVRTDRPKRTNRRATRRSRAEESSSPAAGPATVDDAWTSAASVPVSGGSPVPMSAPVPSPSGLTAQPDDTTEPHSGAAWSEWASAASSAAPAVPAPEPMTPSAPIVVDHRAYGLPEPLPTRNTAVFEDVAHPHQQG